ncbi:MAG: sugar ABC transporter permease [Desulfurococcaceae archaeon]
MGSRATSKERLLYPPHVAAALVVASIALYAFFSIWPMAFSIGLAFTDANEKNMVPNPQMIASLENARSCALAFASRPEAAASARGALRSSEQILEAINASASRLLQMLVNGSWDPLAASLTVQELWQAANNLSTIPVLLGEAFNCTELGYPTSIPLISPDALSNLTRIYELSSIVAVQYVSMSPQDLESKLRALLGFVNVTLAYLRELDVNYVQYMQQLAGELAREEDSLRLHYVGLSNFVKLFEDPRFIYSLYKTSLFVVTSVPIKVLLGLGLALLFASQAIYGRRIMRGLLLTPWALPILLSGMAWQFLFRPNGLLGSLMHIDIFNNEWQAFLVYNLFEAWLAYPFIMTVVMGALSGVSRDLIEAAYVDGAGLWARYRMVILPLISRPLILATILTTGASLQAFMVPLLINYGQPFGVISVPLVGTATGRLNDMLLLFGYDRVTIDHQYAYAAATYVVVVAIIIAYVLAWFAISRRR